MAEILTGGIFRYFDKKNITCEEIFTKDGFVSKTSQKEELQKEYPKVPVLNIEGRYALPGFTQYHRAFFKELFEGEFYDIDPVFDFEFLLDEIEDFCSNQDGGVLALGFNQSLFDLYPSISDRTERLDEVTGELPFIMISSSCEYMALNTSALNKGIALSIITKEKYETGDYTIDDIFNLTKEIFYYDKNKVRKRLYEGSQELNQNGYIGLYDFYSPYIFKKLIFEEYGNESGFILNDIEFKGLETDTFRFIDNEFFQEDTFETTRNKIQHSLEENHAIFIECLGLFSLERAFKLLSLAKEEGYHNKFIISTDTDLEKANINDYNLPENTAFTWLQSGISDRITEFAKTSEEAFLYLFGAGYPHIKNSPYASNIGDCKEDTKVPSAINLYTEDPFSLSPLEFMQKRPEKIICK